MSECYSSTLDRTFGGAKIDGIVALKMSESGTTERKKFKDWFDQAAIEAWVAQVSMVYPKFSARRFRKLASRGLDRLEFKGRILQISRALVETLPQDRGEALRLLRESLPQALPDCDSPTDGWLQWPMGEFVAEFGLQHFDESLELMLELTQCFTAEFAVRPFVESFPEKTFQHLQSLTTHPSAHVRRWCSEGLRPRLPWGQVLKGLVCDPTPLWPILDALKDDSELYVRRSVANNLNDIAKDHPEMVVDLCRRWKVRSNPRRDWVIKHALRTLVKNAHLGALDLLGFGEPKIGQLEFEIAPRTIQIGGHVELQTHFTNPLTSSQQLQVDYVVHFIRQKAKTSEKVFKWKTLQLGPGERVDLVKKHSMKLTSIRALYPGRHKVEIQINGLRLAAEEFELRE